MTAESAPPETTATASVRGERHAVLLRASGLLVAIDAALTLGLGAALWFLVFLVIPVVITEMVVGVKLLAGKERWYPAVGLVVFVDYGIGLSLIDGILAPLAVACLAVTTLLFVTWVVGLILVVGGRRQAA